MIIHTLTCVKVSGLSFFSGLSFVNILVSSVLGSTDQNRVSSQVIKKSMFKQNVLSKKTHGVAEA